MNYGSEVVPKRQVGPNSGQAASQDAQSESSALNQELLYIPVASLTPLLLAQCACARLVLSVLCYQMKIKRIPMRPACKVHSKKVNRNESLNSPHKTASHL